MTEKNKRKKKNQTRAATVRIADVSEAERLKVVAAIVLERLRKPDVLWIRVAGPHATTADDLQIGTKNRVDAYQVRWSEWADNLTIEQLTEPDSGVLKQLANRWKRLKEQYKLPVIVHLVTNDHPSSKKLAEDGKNDFHLAKFLAAEWKLKPSQDGIWSDIWSQLQDASKLRDKEFADFVEHCKFDCSYAVPSHDEDGEDDQPFHMVQYIHQKLFDTEGGEQHIVELNRAELYELLGWELDGAQVLRDAPQVAARPARSVDDQFVDQLWSKTKEHRNDGGIVRGAEEDHPSPAPAPNDVQYEWQDMPPDEPPIQQEVAQGVEGSVFSQEPTHQAGDDVFSQETAHSLDDDESSESGPTSFVGRKNSKAKKSWKDLAKDQIQTPGQKRLRDISADNLEAIQAPSDSDGGDEDNKPKKPNAARLRKLLGSRVNLDAFEPEETEDQENAEQDQFDSGVEQQLNFGMESDVSTALETSPEQTENEPNGTAVKEPEVAESEDKWKPSKKLIKPFETPALEPMPEDSFSKLADLARKQEHVDAASSAEILDAFLWYYNNGNELYAEGRFEGAEPEYLRALEILSTLETPEVDKEFDMLEKLGDIYQLLDRPEQAVELYERAKDTRFASKIPVAKYIAALLRLGSVYEDHNQFNEAETEYRKAVDASSSLDENDPLVERANSACLRVSKMRKTLFTRFDASEFDRFRDRQEDRDKAIMHRKKREDEPDIEQSDIWKGDVTTRSQPTVAPAKEPSSKKQWVISMVLLLVTFAFAYALLIPNSGKTVVDPNLAEAVVESYSSTDGRKTMDLHGDGSSQYTFDGKFKNSYYHFVGDDIQELLPLIPGHLRTNFVFFKMADKAVIDQDGTYLYPHKAPELKVVESMWEYSKLAQEYSNEKFSYPDSVENWKLAKGGGTYKNPCTNGIEYATVTSASGDTHESYMRESIEAGELWKNQPEAHPGGIACNNYNGRLFFIRGYDRNGKWLTSSEPKKPFYIELRRGLAATKEKLKEIQRNATPRQDALKDTSFIFESGSEVESRLGLVKTVVPGILFLFVAFSLGLWRHRINKDQSKPVDFVLCIVSIALLVAWYVIGLLDVT